MKIESPGRKPSTPGQNRVSRQIPPARRATGGLEAHVPSCKEGFAPPTSSPGSQIDQAESDWTPFFRLCDFSFFIIKTTKH